MVKVLWNLQMGKNEKDFEKMGNKMVKVYWLKKMVQFKKEYEKKE